MATNMEDKENGPSYRHGTIQKILFENFLTYDHVVVEPGPYLNVVIGPNGTGKSSIICGICLAVGGKPSLLGRSENYSDFVKHGKQEAKVELDIWDAHRKRLVKITCQLRLGKNTAHFLIDGKPMKVSEVREEMKSYNIQVDNPCTFLAQDKVKSFAEQGAQILLRNTEKAGSPELMELHDQLLKIAEDGSEFPEKLARLRKRLEAIDLEMKSKKARVENYMEWESQNKLVTLVKIKRALIEYQKHLDTLREATALVDEARGKLDESAGKRKPIEDSLKALDNNIVKLENDIVKMRRQSKEEYGRIRDAMEHSNIDNQLQDAAANFEKVQKDLADWDTEKGNIREQRDQFKNMLEQLRLKFNPDPELPIMEAELLRENKRLKEEEKILLDHQQAIYRLENELHTRQNAERDIMERKMRKLVQMRDRPAIMHAWNFYVKNRDQFQGEVFVPFLNMHIPESNNLVYFNNVIGAKDLGIFIFSCREDEELMLSKFKIDTSIVSQRLIDNFRANKKPPIEDNLKQLGFVGYLLDLMEAPEPVAAYLNGYYFLDNILIGNSTVDDNYERICNQARRINPKAQLFLTRRQRIEVTGSRYEPGREYVQRTNLNYESRNQKFVLEHTKRDQDNFREEQRLAVDKQQWQQHSQQFVQERDQWRERAAVFRQQNGKEKQARDEIENVHQRLNQLEKRLADFNRQKPDLEQAKAAHLETNRRLADQALDNFEGILHQLEQERAKATTWTLNVEDLNRMKARRTELVAEKEGLDDGHTECDAEYKTAMRNREVKSDNVKNAKKKFKELANFSPAENEQSAEEKKEFAQIKEQFEKKKLPDDEEKLEQIMARQQKKAALGRREGTLKDVDEYEKLKKEQVDALGELERTNERNERWKQRMDEKLDAWLKKLRRLVAKISTNFSQFFARLECAGEVQLEEPDDKYNVDGYGIKILVKFRNGTVLRELNPLTQSGGERSVATMLYIMALQNLCLVPFRCVDEINQGMDPQNERAVFNMMVNLLNSGGHVSNTQYFLLTPKLLNGLDFNERVTVHVVHNGPFIDNADDWNLSRLLAANAL